MKTNKAVRKRFKITRGGKILARKSGQNHFNAKESGRRQLGKSRYGAVKLSNKTRSRFLVNL
ncbi:50S ribosomal protein L35 [Patescibacteria group bacterium]|nr:MAG: 50S ribosomal protein L35 [Patescibacteria group bacterium]